MSIDVKNGYVQNLKSIAREKGHGGQVSVAVFNIDGVPAEYNLGLLSWGASPEDPPFHDGERIFSSGEMKNGKFIINSFYLPEQNKYVNQPIFPMLSMAFGLSIIAIAAGLTLIHQIFKPDGNFFKCAAIFSTSFIIDIIFIYIIAKKINSRNSLMKYIK